MKTASDPRHLSRQKLIQHLFAYQELSTNLHPSIKSIIENLPAIDQLIQTHAPEWEIAKIYQVDLAILRLAIYELTIAKTEPPKAIIDEAIELAKEFGNLTSPGFINGVLGAIIKNIIKN